MRKLISFLLLAVPSFAAISIGSHNCATLTGSGNTIVNTGISITTGSLLAVIGVATDAITVSSIADSTGANTYVTASARSHVTGVGNLEIWYAKNVTGNASLATTITFSGSTANRRMCVLEVKGANTSSPLDQAAGGTTGTGTTATSGNITTTLSREILIAGVIATNPVTADANYTISDQSGTGTGLEYRIVAVSGTYNATFTFSSIGWAISIASFADATQPAYNQSVITVGP